MSFTEKFLRLHQRLERNSGSFGLFAADFARIDCTAGDACKADFADDGDVDASDLAVFAANFGRTDCP